MSDDLKFMSSISSSSAELFFRFGAVDGVEFDLAAVRREVRRISSSAIELRFRFGGTLGAVNGVEFDLVADVRDSTEDVLVRETDNFFGFFDEFFVDAFGVSMRLATSPSSGSPSCGNIS